MESGRWLVPARDDDNGLEAGAVYVYWFNGVFWEEKQKLTASDGQAGDEFGYTMAISGNQAIITSYRGR